MVVNHPKDQDHFKLLLDEAGSNLVIVDFFASWCGPCKIMAPKFEKLSAEFPDKITFIKVDVDEEEALANEYSVNVMPTFIFIKNGEVIDRVEGNQPDELRRSLESNIQVP